MITNQRTVTIKMSRIEAIRLMLMINVYADDKENGPDRQMLGEIHDKIRKAVDDLDGRVKGEGCTYE